jgi:hypothetical protein
MMKETFYHMLSNHEANVFDETESALMKMGIPYERRDEVRRRLEELLAYCMKQPLEKREE